MNLTILVVAAIKMTSREKHCNKRKAAETTAIDGYETKKIRYVGTDLKVSVGNENGWVTCYYHNITLEMKSKYFNTMPSVPIK